MEMKHGVNCVGVERVGLWERCISDDGGNEVGFECLDVVDQERYCKENSNIFSQDIAFAITSCYILFEQGGPKEDLCMIAFQPQGVSVWDGAEVVHLQAEETKLKYSKKTEHNTVFHQIVDFLEASHIRYALTVCPTVYVLHIRQFWSTARVETTDGETKVLAKVNGRQRTIFESSIRRHLKLNDEEATNRTYNFSKMIFDGMMRNVKSKGKFLMYPRTVELFASMLVPHGEGSKHPSEPHNTPSNQDKPIHHEQITQSPQHAQTTSQEPTIPSQSHSVITTPRRITRWTIRISQSKIPLLGADETAFPIGDVRYGEAFPTVTRLDAGHDRKNIAKTYAMPHEASPRVTSLGGGKGSMQQKLQELMDICTSLTLKDNEKRREGFAAGDAPNTRGGSRGGFAANILASGGLRSVFTTTTVATASLVVSPAVATASGSFPTATIFTIASVATPTTRVTRSSRGVVIKSLSPISLARDLEAKFSQEDQIIREQAERDSEIARIHAERELEMMIAELEMMIAELDRSNEIVTKYLSEYKQAEAGLSHDEKVELIDELLMYQRNLAQIKKYQAQQNKPATKTERRNFYMSILRSNADEVSGTEPSQEQQSEEPKELSDEELKKMTELVPVEELYIEALQVKESKERLDVVKSLMACKTKPGAFICVFVLEKKGYFDILESLNMVFDAELSINIIISSLLLQTAEQEIKKLDVPSTSAATVLTDGHTAKKRKTSHSNRKEKAVKEKSDCRSKRKVESKIAPTSDPKEAVCFYCNTKGHWKSSCPKYLKDLKDGKVEKGSHSGMFMIELHNTTTSNPWVLDTSYPEESFGYLFYKPKDNVVFVAPRGMFLEREMISKEDSGSKIYLEEIQEYTNEEPIVNTDTQQEAVSPIKPDDISLPIRITSGRVNKPPQFYYGFHIKEDNTSDSTLSELDEPANYKEAMASPEAANEDESCIYVKVSGSVVVFLVLYVDNILLIENDIPMLQSVKDWLGKCFAMKDLGDAAFILGSIMYAMTCTRLDVSFALSMVSRHQQNLGEGHWTAAKNILKYLRNYKDMFLVYGGEEELRVTGYCDQACEASNEAILMKNFIGDLGVVPTVQDPIEIFCDNESAFELTKEPRDHRKSKHIERKYYFV
nr:hypothetical protein [Tanacetum cinerariifolium]